MSNFKSFKDINGKAKQLRKQEDSKFVHTGHAHYVDGSSEVLHHPASKIAKRVMHLAKLNKFM